MTGYLWVSVVFCCFDFHHQHIYHLDLFPYLGVLGLLLCRALCSEILGFMCTRSTFILLQVDTGNVHANYTNLTFSYLKVAA